MKIQKFTLEVVVFICGAVVMAYEIIGSRILGPYVGTSIFVWASIIGIILLSLSSGYYFGGRMADRYPNQRRLGMIIGISGMFILASLLIKKPLLMFLSGMILNVQLNALLSSLLLFAAPAFLLGMVSPYAARLKIRNTRSAGATVGYLYALSTIGSIFGTFLAGFYLIPGFRLTSIMLILGIALLVVAALLYITSRKKFTITINPHPDEDII